MFKFKILTLIRDYHFYLSSSCGIIYGHFVSQCGLRSVWFATSLVACIFTSYKNISSKYLSIWKLKRTANATPSTPILKTMRDASGISWISSAGAKSVNLVSWLGQIIEQQKTVDNLGDISLLLWTSSSTNQLASSFADGQNRANEKCFPIMSTSEPPVVTKQSTSEVE